MKKRTNSRYVYRTIDSVHDLRPTEKMVNFIGDLEMWNGRGNSPMASPMYISVVAERFVPFQSRISKKRKKP